MTATPVSSPEDLIDTIRQLGSLRVWSVIITFFGDTVMPRGGVVSASVLATVCSCLGIKQEALRVALYRLAKDGWIDRQKEGRNSFYALSESGLENFLPASRRIYADGPELRGPWRLAILPVAEREDRAAHDRKLRSAGFIPLSNSLFLGAAQSGPAPDQSAVMEGTFREFPDWIRATLAPEPLQREYAALRHALAPAADVISTFGPLKPEVAVALRTLIIHQWRRLLLRHPDLPPEMLPTGWQGETCRGLVLTLHQRISLNASPWLDEAVGPKTG